MTTPRIASLVPVLVLSAALFLSGCASQQYQPSRGQQYAATGTALGALVGALTAKNKLTGAALGAGAGLLLGYVVGNEMDKQDQARVVSTLEHSPSGRTSSWVNPDSGRSYSATPSPAYVENDRVYRDVEIETWMDGRRQTVHATAYRAPDGTWRLVQ